MAYKVIRPFKDLTDPKKHDYSEGETFPREGHEPTEEFISGLLTGFNSAGSIFLSVEEEIPEETPENTEEENTEEETPENTEEENTEEETPAEKPKRKRTPKKAEE